MIQWCQWSISSRHAENHSYCGSSLQTSNLTAIGVTCPMDALDILHKRKGYFHIVLADIHMPGMSGFELFDIVQKQFRIPVIFVSGDDCTETMAKAVDCGACSYILKPVNKNSIQYVGQIVMREQLVNRGRILEIGGSMRKDNAEDLSPLNVKKMQQENANRDKDRKIEADRSRIPTKRMAWTTNLHERFLAAIEHLGDENATPTAILKFMNIKGLTKRNIGSHLQKHRLRLKGKKEASQSYGEILDTGNPCHAPGLSQLNYPSVPTATFQAHDQNNIQQQWKSGASDLNQQGLINYAESQLWNRETMTGVAQTKLSSNEHRHLDAFDRGSTEAVESSNFFMNPNPNMPQVTTEAPLLIEHHYQNLEQELNQPDSNNYAEPQLWNREQLTGVDQTELDGSTQVEVGDSSDPIMNLYTVTNMLQVTPPPPLMMDPYYQNLEQELTQHVPNNYSEPQLWNNEGVTGVGQTNVDILQVTAQASWTVENPYPNFGEVDTLLQFTPYTSGDDFAHGMHPNQTFGEEVGNGSFTRSTSVDDFAHAMFPNQTFGEEVGNDSFTRSTSDDDIVRLLSSIGGSQEENQ